MLVGQGYTFTGASLAVHSVREGISSWNEPKIEFGTGTRPETEPELKMGRKAAESEREQLTGWFTESAGNHGCPLKYQFFDGCDWVEIDVEGQFIHPKTKAAFTSSTARRAGCPIKHINPLPNL